MISFLGLRRRDLLPEAKELQDLVVSVRKFIATPVIAKCSSSAGEMQTAEFISNDANIGVLEIRESSMIDSANMDKLMHQLVKRMVRECEIQQTLLDKYSSKIVVHEIVHTRIEYLLWILKMLVENDRIFDRDFKIVMNHVLHLFSIVHSISIIIHDNIHNGKKNMAFQNSESDNLYYLPEVQQWDQAVHEKLLQDVKKLPPHKSHWYSICRTAIATKVSQILKKKPQTKEDMNITMATACMAVHSSYWEIQYLSLAYIAASLFQEASACRSSIVYGEAGKGKMDEGKFLSPNKGSAECRRPLLSEWKGKTPSRKLVKQNTLTSSSMTNIHGKKQPIAIKTKDSEELYRNGMLRTVTWSLLHEYPFIRQLASETLSLFIQAAEESTLSESESLSIKSSGSVGESNLWSSCVEQGIFPLLEYIAVGIPLVHLPTFTVNPANHLEAYQAPEADIRAMAKVFLQRIALALELASISRNRLTGALTHSGNQNLRINIFLGLMLSCGRSSQLGRLLCNDELPRVAEPSNGLSPVVGSFINNNATTKHFLLQMLQSISNNQDGEEMRRLLYYIVETLKLAFRNQYVKRCSKNWVTTEQRLSLPAREKSIIPPQAPPGSSDESVFSSSSICVLGSNSESLQILMDRINPVIVVINKLQSGGNSNVALIRSRSTLQHNGADTVKMLCPPLSIIRSHSSKLAKDIADFHQVQLREALLVLAHRQGEVDLEKLNPSIILSWEKDVKSMLNSQGILEDNLFYTIQGSYSLWQDIFTHMSDEYLLNTSIGKMSLSDLLEAFYISFEYGMPMLLEKYTQTLMTKVSTASLLQIMNCIIKESIDSSPSISAIDYKLHTELCLKCLEFIHSEWDNIRKKLPPNHIQQLLHAVANTMAVILL